MGNCAYKKQAFILKTLFLGVLVYLSIHNASVANECVQTITNPAPAGEVLNYGAARANCKAGPRVHRGVDIMLEMCLPVQPQQGCTVMMNGNTPLFKTGGYGLYARFNCGPRVEVRYAHLNSWSNGMAINGRSGAARSTPPHIHYEVVIDGVKVDPKCVWGSHPNPSDCGIANGGRISGIQPADMCDGSVLEALKANARGRYTNRLNCMTSSKTIVDGVSPSSITPTGHEVDLPECEEYTGPNDGHHEHDDIEGEDLEDNPLPVIQPPIMEVPDPVGLPDPIPGTPGDDPNLAPPPEEPNDDLEVSGCAADTWTAMVNQAVMQTRREDLVNKRLIVKPDSVLDYSCFNRQILEVAVNAGPIFSETTRWDNVTVDIIGKSVDISLRTKQEDNDPFFSEKDYNFEREYEQSNGTTITLESFSPISLDMAIDSLVGKASAGYFSTNFNQGYVSDTVPPPAAYPATCNVMSAVWAAAKCKNFEDSSIFYTFEDLVGTDPREFPLSMPCL